MPKACYLIILVISVKIKQNLLLHDQYYTVAVEDILSILTRFCSCAFAYYSAFAMFYWLVFIFYFYYVYSGLFETVGLFA